MTLEERRVESGDLDQTPASEHILILFAYHFPPDTAIGGARPYRFYKYLRRLGYRVHVITATPQTNGPQEDVEYVPDPFQSNRRGLGWQVERTVRRLLLPGVLGLSWAHVAAEAARKYIRARSGAAAVLSTCPPFGTHYAAWRLARAENLPWIADFRDPFGGSTLRGLSGLQPHNLLLFDWLEKRVIESADLVIANTDAVAEDWKLLYPAQAHKIELIWNGFDPELPMTPLPLEQHAYKTLSHAGELYAGRTVAPILQSVGRLIDAGRISAQSIRLKVVGHAKASVLPSDDFLTKARSLGWLDLITESVSQAEARRITQTSEFLLLIQPQSAVQVPGKLFEYLQIGRPILAFLIKNSAVERILQRAGVPYRCVYSDDTPQQIDAVIEEFLQLSPDAITPSEWFQNEFQAQHQAQTLASLIQRLPVKVK